MCRTSICSSAFSNSFLLLCVMFSNSFLILIFFFFFFLGLLLSVSCSHFFFILSSFFLTTYPYNLSCFFLAYFIFKFLQNFHPNKSTVVLHSEPHNSVINSFHHSSKRGRNGYGTMAACCQGMDSSKHSNYDNKFFLNFSFMPL